MDKIEIARRQLGMALHLYIENLDPVSVHSLAGNSREIIDRLADQAGSQTFRDHMISANPGLTEKRYYSAANLYRNAFKHLEKKDDQGLLDQFEDEQNKHLLFVSWYTYQFLQKQLPIEAQCFQIWYFAQEGERAADKRYSEDAIVYFGDMSHLTIGQRKGRLKIAIDRGRSDPIVMSDAKTEKIPLVYVNR